MPALPSLQEIAPAFAEHSVLSSQECARQQLAFSDALLAYLTEHGLPATIQALNSHGHALEFISKSDGGWLIYREPMPDGEHELQISCLADGPELMITTPMTDAAWNRMLEARQRELSPQQQATEALCESFYSRGSELYANEPREFDALPISEQVVLALHTLDMEINNGGFAQYFSNTGGQFAQLAIAYLQEIEAPQTAELLSEAWQQLGAPTGSQLTNAQMDLLEQCESALDHLDASYYDSTENVALLAMQWIARTNPNITRN